METREESSWGSEGEKGGVNLLEYVNQKSKETFTNKIRREEGQGPQTSTEGNEEENSIQEKAEKKLGQRIQIFKLFRGNLENIRQKLQVLQKVKEATNPCLDAELERKLINDIQKVEKWNEWKLADGSSSEYKITQSLQMTPFNQVLFMENEFTNPSLLNKAIDYWDIDEIASNYPKEMYNPHEDIQKEDLFEEIALRQNEQLYQQQEEIIKKKRQVEAAREKIVEQRAQRIAMQTNTDVKMVEETLQRGGVSKDKGSRFDSIAINQALVQQQHQAFLNTK